MFDKCYIFLKCQIMRYLIFSIYLGWTSHTDGQKSYRWTNHTDGQVIQMNESYSRTKVIQTDKSHRRTKVIQMNKSYRHTSVIQMNKSYRRTKVIQMNKSYRRTKLIQTDKRCMFFTSGAIINHYCPWSCMSRNLQMPVSNEFQPHQRLLL